MKHLLKKPIVCIALLAISPQIALANQANNPQQNNPQQTIPAKNTIKWLGISLDNLSPALRSQLGTQVTANQGVLIKDVQGNSPAKKAGLQAFDVLTAFNGENITDTQQVYKLVQNSNENQEIKLEIIRQGKKETLTANIGSREVANNLAPSFQLPFQQPLLNNRFGVFNHPFWNPRPGGFYQDWPQFQAPTLPEINNGKVQSWSQSESLSVKTLADGKIHAELKSKDKDGNEKNYIYEGDRETVIKQINEEKDMPQNIRDQLLGAVQGNPSIHFHQDFFKNNAFPAAPGFPFSNQWQGFPQQDRTVY